MITIVLHTHLPWVLRHGTWPHGSDWICEAVAECYLPLLKMCDRLLADGIRPGITFGISPVLCEQLAHPDFPAMFERFCDEHIELVRADRSAFGTQEASEHDRSIAALAAFWEEWFLEARRTFVDVYQRDILGAFRRLQDADAIAIITCGATHGYLPLLAEDASVDLQLRAARDQYTRTFGQPPRGIWLPECAYRPGYAWRTLLPVSAYSIASDREGIEAFLCRYGIEYFITDQEALHQARPLGVDVPLRYRIPMHEASSRTRTMLDERSPFDLFRVGSESRPETVAVFTRHVPISMQVWSGATGYPGDPDYLDFHKKHYKSGIRYWRVTDNSGDMALKTAYMPENARARAAEHARHYAEVLDVTIRHRQSETGGECTVCLPFDTELFGHWWFEGPVFLEHLLREIAARPGLATTTTNERLDTVQPRCVVALPESSWGKNGTDEVWMNPDTQWTWEREYALERRMRMLAEKHQPERWDATMADIMVNALRQMMLAQASDWQFLITNFSAREYATMRFHNHASDAERLCNTAERYASTGHITEEDAEHLAECSGRDDLLTPELQTYVHSL